MSSASRNEQLEALLAAQYALKTCDDSEKEIFYKRWNTLLDNCLSDHPGISRMDLVEAINSRYVEYARNRRSYERPRGNVVRS